MHELTLSLHVRRVVERTGDIPSFAGSVAELRARALIATGHLDEALRCVREALAAGWAAPSLPLLECELLAALGRYAEAEAELKAGCWGGDDHEPGTVSDSMAPVTSRHLLAEVLLLDGRPGEAELETRAVLEDRPSFGPAWLTLGESLVAQARTDDFEALCERAATEEGSRVLETVLRAAEARRRGDFSAAESHLRERERRQPHDPFLLRARAELIAARGHQGRPLQAAARAVLQIEPLCPRTWALLRAEHGASVVAKDGRAARA